MADKHGNLSINSDNIFPIIKKWLYSDHDIFYRELISNGCDAITKLKKLDMMGEFETPEDTEFKITVTVDPEEKTISFTDNGLGMTFEELDEYINQIAFSGAKDFLSRRSTGCLSGSSPRGLLTTGGLRQPTSTPNSHIHPGDASRYATVFTQSAFPPKS